LLRYNTFSFNAFYPWAIIDDHLIQVIFLITLLAVRIVVDTDVFIEVIDNNNLIIIVCLL